MIIFNRILRKKANRKERKSHGKKWWKSRTRVLLTIYIFLLCGAIIGGGSVLRKSIKQGKLQASVQKNIRQSKRRLIEFVRYLHSFTVPLPEPLYIDIKFKDYEKVKQKRQEALDRGFLLASKDDFVSARLRYGSETVPVKLRLKGDLSDHWKGEKWSFRIHTKGDARFKGMKRFSIQDPKTRNYIYEWGFLENLRLEGILAPRYDFINVIINGKHKGIYALEEFFSKELLESQGRRESVIVKFDDDTFWHQKSNWVYDTTRREPVAPGFFILQPRQWLNSRIDVVQGTKTGNDSFLTLYRDTAIGLLEAFRKGEKQASDVFDESLLAKFLAIANLWSAEHSTEWTDLIFYYNPITSKLEPIGYDAFAGRDRWKHDAIDKEKWVSGQASEQFPWGTLDWISQALSDPKISELYIKECFRISDPKYLDWLKSELQRELNKKLLILWREHQDNLDWHILSRNQDFTKHVLKPVEQIIAYVDPKELKSIDTTLTKYSLKFDIGNLLTLPVEILGVRINDGLPLNLKTGSTKSKDDSNIVLRSLNPFEELQIKSFYLPLSEEVFSNTESWNNINIKVISRILGSPFEHETSVLFISKPHFIENLPHAQSINKILKEYLFISYLKESNEFYVKSGEWVVKKDIILPEGSGLVINEDTTLKFDPGTVISVKGHLFLKGSEENPIELSAKAKDWSGLIVVNSKRCSRLENVIIKDVNAVNRGGWILTGGITFYQSPVIFDSVEVRSSYSEDAVNIVRSKFKIINTIFTDCMFDALDSDFSIGTIDNSIFKNIKGDAIDVSSTKLDIKNVNITLVGDKAISVGEKSKVSINKVAIEDVDIGVASKDYSEATIDGLKIKSANIGLTAYQKKPEYGPATITANNVIFEDVKKDIFLQQMSHIDIDGVDYPTQDFNADVLYQENQDN